MTARPRGVVPALSSLAKKSSIFASVFASMPSFSALGISSNPYPRSCGDQVFDCQAAVVATEATTSNRIATKEGNCTVTPFVIPAVIIKAIESQALKELALIIGGGALGDVLASSIDGSNEEICSCLAVTNKLLENIDQALVAGFAGRDIELERLNRAAEILDGAAQNARAKLEFQETTGRDVAAMDATDTRMPSLATGQRNEVARLCRAEYPVGQKFHDKDSHNNYEKVLPDRKFIGDILLFFTLFTRIEVFICCHRITPTAKHSFNSA
jgi:hypothetical protein